MMRHFPKLPIAIALSAAAVISAVPRVVLAEQRNAIAQSQPPEQPSNENQHGSDHHSSQPGGSPQPGHQDSNMAVGTLMSPTFCLSVGPVS